MYAAAVCYNNSLAVLTGGAFAYLSDVHQLNLRTLEWTKVDGVDMYGGRTSLSAVRWRNAIIAFGGCNSMTAGGYLNDSIEVEVRFCSGFLGILFLALPFVAK